MSDKILFVDDEQNILLSMKRSLHSRYDIHVASSAVEGWQILQDKGPFKVVISDFRMPSINGMQFLVKVREVFPDVMRIMLTGQADYQAAIDAVNRGELFRFLNKPFPATDMIKVLDEAIKKYDLKRVERELLEDTLQGTVKLMVDMLSIMNPAAFGMAGQMRDLAKKLCQRMEIVDVWEIDLGMSLSQIGVVALPAEVVEKIYNGEAHDEMVWRQFCEHADIGFKLLSRIPRLQNIAEGIRLQCKHFDGSGYPEDAISGEKLPLISRMAKILFDFLVYVNSGMENKDALVALQNAWTKYDKQIMDPLVAEIMEKGEELVLKKLRVSELRPGMIVAGDVETTTGILLLKSRTEINDVNILRLRTMSQAGKIPSILQVFTAEKEAAG